MKKNGMIGVLAIVCMGACFFSVRAADNVNQMVNPNAESDRGWTYKESKDEKNDDKIAQRIRHALRKDKEISGTQRAVKIVTFDGVTTLSGWVKSRREEKQIVDAVAEVVGKENVRSRLTIRRK